MHFILRLPEYADFSLATLKVTSSCTCRELDEAGFAIETLTKEHQWVNCESARWICHLIQRAQPQRRCCIGMQQRRRMAIVSTSQIQNVVIRIVTGLWGDPLIVARTGLKLSNGVVAAGPPFLKTSSVQVFTTHPGTLLIDRTKYVSGVPREY